MRRAVLVWRASYWVLLGAVIGIELSAYLGAPGIDWRWATADLLIWIAVGVVVFTR